MTSYDGMAYLTKQNALQYRHNIRHQYILYYYAIEFAYLCVNNLIAKHHLTFNWFKTLSICDVIWEKHIYGGEKMPGYGKMLRRMRGVWTEARLFVTHKHLKETPSPLSAQVKNILWVKHIEKADIGKHSLFLY